MKILGFRILHGPNVFHSKPVMIMSLDLKSWTDQGSHQLPGFNEKLLKLLPGLLKHTCSPGYAGGFAERLNRGTYLAHITEHVAIELSHLAGIPVSYGKTRYAGAFGHYEVVVRMLNEAGMKMCLQAAFEIVKSLLVHTDFDISTRIEEIKRAIKQTSLGPSAQSLWQAAESRGIPVRRLGEGSLLQFGYGKYCRRVQTAVTDRTGLIAAEIAQDKQLTKTFLEENAIPVPKGFVISNQAELFQALEAFPGPYVVKPLDGHHGQGVALHLESQEDILKAYESAQKFSSSVLIEEMCRGQDYRVLVIGGQFAAACERKPPQVQGDGKSTVQALIDKLNSDPRRGEGHDSDLTQVTIDESLLDVLKRQGFQLQSILKQGQTLLLRGTANLSSGGTARDITDLVHPEIKTVCERISRIVGLDICGIDLIAQDLTLPLDSSFKVIEVNAGPGLRMHLSPSEGSSRNVGDQILRMIYPPEAPSRIPIVAVTGTNGKTTTVRLIHKILSAGGCIGMTTSDGVYIGKDKIISGDTTGPASAQMVLSDPIVEKAVLEVARGGLLKRGLGYDWSDVGIITNIRPDHIGQDGIETLEDLVWIKSLVAERVKENGTVVLNADDEKTIQLRYNPALLKLKRHFFLYSLDPGNPYLQQHLRAGGDAAWSESGILFLQRQGEIHKILACEDIKCTLRGKATFQVSNVLAAVAGSISMGASLELIRRGLLDFEPAIENTGRLNLYRVAEGYVILDYGHNPDAISAMGELLNKLGGYKKTVCFSLPGDRADHILEMSGEKMAQIFERLVIRDDHDLRGRKPGAVPQLIANLVKRRFPQTQVHISANESDAVERVLGLIKKNEIVVIFYDSFQSVMPLIRQYDPVPVAEIPILIAGPEPRDQTPESVSSTLFQRAT